MAGSARAGSGSLRDQRRREKDRVSRQHILDAAERVFGRKGFHNATLKEIAEQAEFSVGALYGFFDGKDDLFAQVLERQGRALLDTMELAVEGAGSALEKLHRVADAQLDYFRQRPDFYRLFERELGGATWTFRTSLNEAGFERYREVMAFEAGIFREGVASGELRAEDPEMMAALFSGIMQAYIAQWVFGLDARGRSAVEQAYPVSALHELIDRAFVAT
ncbi:MAG: TetR/AcrR family transcriptional regulator [Acidimicrobiales bacterium]